MDRIWDFPRNLCQFGSGKHWEDRLETSAWICYHPSHSSFDIYLYVSRISKMVDEYVILVPLATKSLILLQKRIATSKHTNHFKYSATILFKQLAISTTSTVSSKSRKRSLANPI